MLRESLICVAAALGASCAAPELPRSTTDIDTTTHAADWTAFTVGPNDLIHVSVYGQPELTSPDAGVRVAPDGTLGFPLVGSIPVEGRSAEEIRQTIEASLKPYLHSPSVTVSVIDYSSRRFYLLGQVEKPGPVPMDRPITALEALSMGAGLKSGAREDVVVIMRRHGEEVEVIPFNAETPGPDGFVQVRPDDVLFVSKSGTGVFSDEVLPYLQGLGFTFGQIASAAVAYDLFIR